jgi:hypothetical protein
MSADVTRHILTLGNWESQDVALRLVSHEWRREMDALVRERYEQRLDDYLDAMRIEARGAARTNFLLRLAFPRMLTKPRLYTCSRCGQAYTGILLSCDCAQRDEKERRRLLQTVLACALCGSLLAVLVRVRPL